MTADEALSDEALMGRVKAGDEQAFEELFQRHKGMLQARFRRQLRPNVLRKVSVADLLQETRMVVFQRAGDFEDRGEGSVRKWLDRIAEMKVRETVRRYRRAKRSVQNEVTRGHRPDTAHVVAHDPSPSEIAITAEDKERVRHALEKLSADHREVLRLAREERLNLREVGERMGRSHEAARKLYARALARLTKVLNGG